MSGARTQRTDEGRATKRRSLPLVRVATFRDPVQAHLARALLESQGLPATIADEHVVGMDWTASQAGGGAKLQVRAYDAERAREILAEARDARCDLEGEEEVPCPLCGGPGESLAWADRRTRALGMLIGPVPLTIGRDRMRCRQCRRTWRTTPPHRRVLIVAAAVIALPVLGVLGLPSLLLRLRGAARRLLEPERFECWSCGAGFPRGAGECPRCGIALPGPIAYAQRVRPGRAYDGACPTCHLPFAGADYAPAARRFCSSCGGALPLA